MRTNLLFWFLFAGTLSLFAQTSVNNYIRTSTTGANIKGIAQDSLGRILLLQYSGSAVIRLSCYNEAQDSVLWASEYSLGTNFSRKAGVFPAHDNGSLVVTEEGTQSARFVKFDSAGNQVWTRTFTQAAIAPENHNISGHQLPDNSFIIYAANALIRVNYMTGSMMWHRIMPTRTKDVKFAGDSLIVVARNGAKLDYLDISGNVVNSWSVSTTPERIALGNYGEVYLGKLEGLIKWVPSTGQITTAPLPLNVQGGYRTTLIDDLPDLEVGKDGNLYAIARLFENQGIPYFDQNYMVAVGKFDTALTIQNRAVFGFLASAGNWRYWEPLNFDFKADGSLLICGLQDQVVGGNFWAVLPPDLQSNCNLNLTYLSANAPNSPTITASTIDSYLTSGTWAVTSASLSSPSVVLTLFCGDSCTTPTPGYSYTTTQLLADFTANHTGTATYAWDFGDGNTSTQQNPSHTYGSTGTYTVNLTVDNGCRVETYTQQVVISNQPAATQLTTAWCGDTLDKLNRSVYADPVASATNYEFELIDTINSDTFYIQNGISSPIVNLSWISGVRYGAVYKVRVRAFASGLWGPWGQVCLLFSPPFPTTQLVTADCGRNLDSLSQIIYIDPVAGASDFEYELTDSASGGVTNYLRGSGNLSLKLIWIPGIQNGATYFVRVRANVGGVWGPYGPVCALRTPAAGPTTQIRAQYCGITLGSLSDLIRADALTGASNYEYELTDSASGGILTYLRNSPNTGFRLSWVTGVQMNRTYFIRVRAFLNGAWTNYGSSCTVRTPAIPATQLQAAYCPFVATAWNNLIRTERVSGADGYEYEFTDTSTSGVVTYLRNSSNLALRLSWVTGLMQNRVYAVRVRARVSGSFGPFGPVCYVTTPNVPMKWAPGDEPMADLGEGQPELSVYPNPSRGEVVWLRFRNWETKPVNVALFDVTGKMMWQQDMDLNETEQQLKIAPGVRLPAGTYLVHVSGNDGSQVRRLVVQ